MAREIKFDRNKKKAKRRAGIIILKKFPEGYKILGLRIYGSFDLPKGGVETNEDVLTAAMRETEEESGITRLNFEWGMTTTQAKNVTLFIASTDQNPTVRPNPETGEYEHHAAHWLTLDDAEKKKNPKSKINILGNDYFDPTSYKINCSKILVLLKSFKPKWNVKLGINQISNELKKGLLKGRNFESRYFNRLKQMEYLINNKKINNQYRFKIK